MIKSVFIFLSLATIVFVSFQNCSNKTFNASSASTDGRGSLAGDLDQGDIAAGDQGNIKDGGGRGGTNTSIPTPVLEQEVVQVKINCDNARSLGKIRSLSQRIVFDDTKNETGRNQVCQFNSGLNLGMRNERMQARYEQYQRLNLPTNAVVCDLGMTTPIQKFKYDDVFVLTFNNRILATNNKTALYQTSPENTINLTNAGNVSIYNYQWLGLREKQFQNVSDDYCLGKSQNAAACSWPITEQNGQIQFDFDEQLLIALGLFASADQQTFGFIITGDDNPEIDCYHQRLEFNMNVEYYIK